MMPFLYQSRASVFSRILLSSTYFQLSVTHFYYSHHDFHISENKNRFLYLWILTAQVCQVCKTLYKISTGSVAFKHSQYKVFIEIYISL